jgi:hypothetical protein
MTEPRCDMGRLAVIALLFVASATFTILAGVGVASLLPQDTPTCVVAP